MQFGEGRARDRIVRRGQRGVVGRFAWMTVVVAALVIWKHRENIARLRAGTENRFKA